MLTKMLYSTNGVLSDLTSVLQDYYSGTAGFTFNITQDAFYIGSKFPFTRKYFKVSTANATTGAMTVDYWAGTQWRPAVEVIDNTSSGGKSLAVSGSFSFVPDKRYPWVLADTTVNGVEKVLGFGTTTVYDMFWIRVKFTGVVAPILDWSGDLFCNDVDLASEYPELNRAAVKTAFLAGKTDWEEQIVAAGELIGADMKKLGISASPGKVLTGEQMRRPAVSKVAALIFNSLSGFQDQAKLAAMEYTKRMDPRAFDIDENENGLDDPAERQVKIYRLTR